MKGSGPDGNETSEAVGLHFSPSRFHHACKRRPGAHPALEIQSTLDFPGVRRTLIRFHQSKDLL